MQTSSTPKGALRAVFRAPCRSADVLNIGLLVATVMLVFWPGRTGPFMLDDLWNLPPLGHDGGIQSLQHWLAFVFGGEAGSLGRPISLASFTLNALYWPADPLAFKLTNIFIHGLNTAAVYWLVRVVLGTTKLPAGRTCALLAALIWGVHPTQVSTVLYVVQRMALLSTLFILLGLIAYAHGRRIISERPQLGYRWIVGGIVGCGALAVFSKENGVLLPLMALAVEYTVFHSLPSPTHWQKVRPVLLRAPVYLLVGYIAFTAPSWLDAYHARPWSPAERLAAQGPILLQYLGNYFVPRLDAGGLFHDGLQVHSLLKLALPAWGVLLFAGVVAIVFRKRSPVLALAVLWFFAAHALESTILPLELAFEHRNYVASVGFVVALAFAAGKLSGSVRGFAGVSVIIALSLMTIAQARIWGNELAAALVWPAEHPNSARAHQFAAAVLQRNGDIARSQTLMQAFSDRNPDDVTAKLQTLELRCLAGEDIITEASALPEALRRVPLTYAVPDTIGHLVTMVDDKVCNLDTMTLHRIIDAAMDSPYLIRHPVQLSRLQFHKARLYAADKSYRAAIAAIEPSRRWTDQFNAPYWQTIWALEAGNVEAAEGYAKQARGLERTRFVGEVQSPFLDALDAAVLEAERQENVLNKRNESQE